MNSTKRWMALNLALAGTLTLGSLVGCAGTTPVAPQGGGQVVAPNGSTGNTGNATGGTSTTGGTSSQAKVASASSTTAEQSAAAMSTEREMDDYAALAGDIEANPAAYSLFVVGAPEPGPGMVGITAIGAEGKGEAKGDMHATGFLPNAGARADAQATGQLPRPTAGGPGNGAGQGLGQAVGQAGARPGARPLAQGLRESIRAQAQARGKAKLDEAKAKAKEAQTKLRDAKKAEAEAREHVKKAREMAKAIKPEVRGKAKAQAQAHVMAIRPRLEKMRDAREKLKGALKDVAFVDNGDGTKTKTLDITESKVVNGVTSSRMVKIVRTVSSEDNSLISVEVTFSQTWPNGSSLNSSRTKVLQADGSYLANFHEEAKFAGGASRVADWTKTISAEGAISGSGTVVVKNAAGEVVRTVTVNHKGKEAAPEVAAADHEAGTVAEVKVDESGTVTATAGTEGAATEPVAIEVTAEGSVATEAADVEAAAEVGTEVQASLAS